MLPDKYALMDGAGNRFAAIDLRRMARPGDGLLAEVARALCATGDRRPLDGLLVLADAADAGNDFDLVYFNRDGSRAAFCGNGARCAAVLASPGGRRDFSFGSDSGPIRAVTGTVGASIAMPDPSGCVELPPDFAPGRVAHRVAVGVPHVVVWCTDGVECVDVARDGARLRAHPALGAEGANVNFAAEVNPSTVRIRTYERGVEGETGACGTGAVACAVSHASLRHRTGAVRTSILPTSAAELIITFHRDRRGIRDVWLEGPARLIEWRPCEPALEGLSD